MMSHPTPPSGFSSLQAIWDGHIGNVSNVIGICVDFLEACKSRGDDYTMRFSLHDPTCMHRGGMKFQFFSKQIKELPPISNPGDVVIIQNFKTFEKGARVGLSNYSTRVCVLSGSSVAESQCPDGSDIQYQHEDTVSWKLHKPSIPELQYAKAIAKLENIDLYPAPAPSTALQIASNMKANGGVPLMTKTRFHTLGDLKEPSNIRPTFVELLGEVRRVFPRGDRVEISLTDYTSNPLLYDYSPGGEADTYDGDPHGYLRNALAKWAGPWGRRTILVTLWDSHAAFFLEHAQEELYVYLKNVQIKLDKNGCKLEGHCRGDAYDPTRVNVAILKISHAETHSELKELLQRKKEYEASAKRDHLPFQRDPRQKRKADDASMGHDTEQKQQKFKYKNKKKKLEKSLNDAGQVKDANTSPSTLASARSDIRCKNVEVGLTSLADILDNASLGRTSAKNNKYTLPFQNCCYKSRVRVVNYFPDDVRDFAAPYRTSEYAELSGNDSDIDSDFERTQRGEDDITWEWRFFLEIEDAVPQPRGNTEYPSPRLLVLVGQREGQHLLKMDACDLHLQSNDNVLQKMSEKLSFVWGDLQSKKEEVGKQRPVIGEQTGQYLKSPDTRARPFECLIMEYGIPLRDKKGRIMDGLDDYQRMFQLFGITV